MAANNNGATTLRTIVHGKGTSISIPQHGKKPSNRHHLVASYSGGNQVRAKHNQSQHQPSVGTSSGSGEGKGPDSGPREQVVGAILDEIAHNRGQLQSILQFINDFKGKGPNSRRGSPEADPGTDAPTTTPAE
jgi:hypothetical protein